MNHCVKSLTICLPDLVFDHATSEANQKGLDLSSLCSGILADHLLTQFSHASAPSQFPIKSIPKRPAPPPTPANSSRSFNVADHFPGFPSGSIRFAQAFVDEALKLPGVQAFRTSRGVGFRPNFVFIEYLMSRGGKAGIGVSFYGEPHRHENRPEILGRGIPSYSRAKIYSDANLRAILPHVPQAMN